MAIDPPYTASLNQPLCFGIVMQRSFPFLQIHRGDFLWDNLCVFYYILYQNMHFCSNSSRFKVINSESVGDGDDIDSGLESVSELDIPLTPRHIQPPGDSSSESDLEIAAGVVGNDDGPGVDASTAASAPPASCAPGQLTLRGFDQHLTLGGHLRGAWL
jgi:hypothetical protein